MLLKGFFFFTLLFLGSESYGQALVVENVRTNNFPELRFDLRSLENLVAGKASLVVKDNYVAVPRFKITAGKTNTSGTAFVVSYTVLDPDRLDGTTTFEYRGQSVTTTYLVKSPTEKQAAAYPKEEHSDNRIFYIIGGLGLLAGVAGFLLARRKNKEKQTAASVAPAAAPPPAAVPMPSAPLPPPPVMPSPQPATPIAPSAPSYEDAYKPKPQPAYTPPPPAYAPPVPPTPAYTPPPPAPVTRITPAEEPLLPPTHMPKLELRLGDRRSTLTLTGRRQQIGRAPECDLLILHPTVSKIHAAVWLQDGTWWVQDLSSTNGTFVDGQRVTRSQLQSGNKVHFGQVAGVFTMPVSS